MRPPTLWELVILEIAERNYCKKRIEVLKARLRNSLIGRLLSRLARAANSTA